MAFIGIITSLDVLIGMMFVMGLGKGASRPVLFNCLHVTVQYSEFCFQTMGMDNKTGVLLLASWLLLSDVKGRLILPQDRLGIFSQDRALDC